MNLAELDKVNVPPEELVDSIDWDSYRHNLPPGYLQFFRREYQTGGMERMKEGISEEIPDNIGMEEYDKADYVEALAQKYVSVFIDGIQDYEDYDS